MVRGDGHLGSYTYARPGRTKAIDAIRTSTRAGVAAISDLIAWPLVESLDWRKGFLAGIYDAEGSCSGGVLRIHNTDGLIIAQILACLERLRFDAVVESRPGACTAVRLRGGLIEQLRFFHTVDPAITRKRTIESRAVKTDARLRVVSVEALGVELPLFDITTGTGDFIANGVVSHNCFARPTHRYLNLSPLGDFERTIVVKTNLVEVLRRELARPSWTGEHVA
ncbi:MAG: intein-containing Rv2578c family radical SAM protein, partial [Pseudonocardiaceae bacterium]